MIAYKGFNKDLTCTLGKGTYRYKRGVWHREDDAKCANTGFHSTDNPLDVLSYYNKKGDRYFRVELRGNIDEDGIDSRISAPEIMLLEEISRDELILLGIQYMIDNPKKKWSNAVTKDVGDADGDGFVIVRGQNPKAKGSKGDVLWIIRQQGEEIAEVACYEVDGTDYLPDVYYDVKGDAVK